jgi:hypothetical protein
MKMAVFWVVVPCGLMKFTDFSEVLVVSIIRAMTQGAPLDVGKLYQTTRHNSPEDSHLQHMTLFKD